MDWLNELPSVTGIDRIVAEAARRLMSGPVIFRSPYWDGEVSIGTLDEYRAWIRTSKRIENEMDAGLRGLEVWEAERAGNLYEDMPG